MQLLPKVTPFLTVKSQFILKIPVGFFLFLGQLLEFLDHVVACVILHEESDTFLASVEDLLLADLN